MKKEIKKIYLEKNDELCGGTQLIVIDKDENCDNFYQKRIKRENDQKSITGRCGVQNCPLVKYARGVCRKHYKKLF